jgi:cytochrome c553
MKIVRWSIAGLLALTVVSLLVGFVWLPSAHQDFSAQGLWDMICRAAGVPRQWAEEGAPKVSRSTRVVLTADMGRAGTGDAVGRGATLALQCSMCHGPKGISVAGAPNLAGQYPEVVIKQMLDYQRGDREHALMQSLARGLSEADMRDLAAYYASLPKPRNGPVTDMDTVPPLVRVGDPMRNIAPCAACHGGIDRKPGAAWLEGMPKDYLVMQLDAFAKGTRRNDSHAQMRNMARTLTKQEIESVSEFYARQGEAH